MSTKQLILLDTSNDFHAGGPHLQFRDAVGTFFLVPSGIYYFRGKTSSLLPIL